MGVYFTFWGMLLAIEVGDKGKLSVPAENQGVVKGEAGEGSDATKHGSKYTKRESAYASLPVCDYHPYFGDEPACTENRRGNYCIMQVTFNERSAASFPLSSHNA